MNKDILCFFKYLDQVSSYFEIEYRPETSLTEDYMFSLNSFTRWTIL